jgi:hypothetical protein
VTRTIIVSLVSFLAVGLFASCLSGGGGDSGGWLVGDWVQTDAYGPHSDIITFSSGGTYTEYNDYEKSSIADSGTWSLSGSTLTLDGYPIYSASKIDDNTISILAFGSSLIFYRKSTEPNGLVFTLTPSSLTDDGAWMVESLSSNEMKLYNFTSVSGGTYELFWDDWDYGSSSYSIDIVVSCYQQNQSTLYFEEADLDHYFSGETVSLGAGEAMYVIVEGIDGAESGNFALKLQ